MKNKFIILALVIIIVSSAISIININQDHENRNKKAYYIGKVVSKVEKDHITRVEVSPTLSMYKDVREITQNHKIEYELDKITIVARRKPNSTSHKKLEMGELREMVKDISVGETIIFKVKDNRSNDIPKDLEIDEIVVYIP
ncbi:hypothetical protein R9X47_15455 [Wukongibacter baidiensis]|uniref:hypothetical protein n=1 Tax=Wukongibacter baidiensis TaxID=1723361 RepID=UPI003D7F19FF